ncbi:MAG: hypothetical protein ACRCVY_08930 [Commensalibacter sp.]
MPSPVVLITFAGRKRQMTILEHYVRQAMEAGFIDEWHIWDFTRQESDTIWLADHFKPVAFISAETGYQAYGQFDLTQGFELTAKSLNNFHIAICPQNESDYFYEIVIGGWMNTQTSIRRVKKNTFSVIHRAEEDFETIWGTLTPGIAAPGVFQKYKFLMIGENLHFSIGDHVFFNIEKLNITGPCDIFVRGGYGGWVELKSDAPVRRYAGVPTETAPYFRAYSYYAQNYEQYKDTLFLKCDDDIVYMDYKKLGGFIEFRRNNPHYFLVSANVVNNGLCAYLQQESGYLPNSVGDFELPVNGFHGTLWESGEKAVKLHEYFLSNNLKTMHFRQPIIRWDYYVSINFVSWLGHDLKYMFLPSCDDEKVLSVDIPGYTQRSHAFYSDFTVSHLSFYQQTVGADFDPILDKYEALIR